jgi:Family of unknown function (DUF6086)
MGAVFTLVNSKGRTLWSPALAVGTLYVDYVRGVEKVVGVESGITSWANDSFNVDPKAMESFAQAIVHRLGSSNSDVLWMELEPVLAITAALLVQANGEPIIAWLTSEQRDVATSIARSMPV